MKHRIQKKEKIKKKKEKEERLKKLKENKEKYEKYLKLKQTLFVSQQKAKTDKDSRKIFVGGIRFDDLDALSKKGKLTLLKNVPPSQTLQSFKVQRQNWFFIFIFYFFFTFFFF